MLSHMSEAPVAGALTGPPLTQEPLDAAQANALAPMFKALGDPVRLRLLSLIAAAGPEVCVCDLTPAFDLSGPTISHHLKVLREAGLVTATKRGVNMWYAVVPEQLEALRGALSRA